MVFVNLIADLLTETKSARVLVLNKGRTNVTMPLDLRSSKF
jgi:hypothetical protein